jgi:hypothetical protein
MHPSLLKLGANNAVTMFENRIRLIFFYKVISSCCCFYDFLSSEKLKSRIGNFFKKTLFRW